MERLRLHEFLRPHLAHVYSGDTVENFIDGAVTQDGKVSFYKAHGFKNTFVSKTGMGVPLIHAVEKSLELGHTPLIMEGYIPRFSKYYRRFWEDGYCEIPEGTAFPVTNIWIPKHRVSWGKLKFFNADDQMVKQLFQQVSPLVVLR